MPNCDFYAAGLDHKSVLEFVVSRSECNIYECYSRFGEQLHQFESLVEIEAHFSINDWGIGAKESILLQLYPRGASGRMVRRRINLDPTKCGGAKFRYSAEGWGLVQLYLEPPRDGQLRPSHTNHNSEARATAWSDTIHDLGAPSDWSWDKVNSFSRRLNRFIRSLGVAKTGSRSILRQAAELQQKGIQLTLN